MGAVRVDGSDVPFVKSAEEMIGRFSTDLITQLPGWKERLDNDPSRFGELEVEVHAAYARGADLLLAGLLSKVMGDEKFLAAAEKTRQEFAQPLRPGRSRQTKVRLLGGLVVWIVSLYCAARRSDGGDAKPRRRGAHIELLQFSFGNGVSPALESVVARQAAMGPSYRMVVAELDRRQVPLGVKAVRRIATQCGEGLLSYRSHLLDDWRNGALAAGSELSGKRISVQFDGGRTRLRGPLRPLTVTPEPVDADGLATADAPGRSRPRPKRTCDVEWREPKLLTIYVHDDNGRMEKKTSVTIDGTFEGPDFLTELAAMHLHRLGGAQAKSVTFVGDGAQWIWDRIPTIIAMAGMQKVSCQQVLDCCHAAHHLALALTALGFTGTARTTLYRLHRTNLRNGQWRQVVKELAAATTELADPTDVNVETAYLTKHGNAGRLAYDAIAAAGLPIGSGAIESNIRRVINQRLKGVGIFWDQDNAEAMLQLRSLLITERWDETLEAMRIHERRHPRTAWRRTPQPMSPKTEADNDKAEKTRKHR